MSTEEKEQAAEERQAQLEAKGKELDEINSKRAGKGTRLRVGQTRGKNPQMVVWEAFDLSKQDTLPTSLDEFMQLTKVDKEPELVAFLIDGYNDAMYTQASDPIAEYVNPAWDEDVQKQFRIVVRNYANSAEVSIEDAVALIKPGVEKKHQKDMAAKAANSEPVVADSEPVKA